VASTCPECSASLGDSGSCRDHFHEMLALEAQAQLPFAAGTMTHFLAVASYNLQHPSAFVPAALFGLRRTVADVLAGRSTLDDARRRARAAADGPTRVLRRPEEQPSDADQAVLRAWPNEWSMTVLDVCRVPPEQYETRVRAWAAAVIDALRDVPIDTPSQERTV